MGFIILMSIIYSGIGGDKYGVISNSNIDFNKIGKVNNSKMLSKNSESCY